MSETNEEKQQENNNRGELTDVETLFCSSSTNIKGLSNCIFLCAVKEKKKSVKLRAVGASAINQMVKAIILAKGKLSERGIKMTFDMYFADIDSKVAGEDNISGIEYCVTF